MLCCLVPPLVRWSCSTKTIESDQLSWQHGPFQPRVFTSKHRFCTLFRILTYPNTYLLTTSDYIYDYNSKSNPLRVTSRINSIGNWQSGTHAYKVPDKSKGTFSGKLIPNGCCTDIPVTAPGKYTSAHSDWHWANSPDPSPGQYNMPTNKSRWHLIYLPCRDFAALFPLHSNSSSYPCLCLCSFDIRDRDAKSAKRWSDETVFGNRAYFIYDKQPGQLAIQHVRDEDTGLYRCRVDFQVAQTRNSIVNLTVIGKCEIQDCVWPVLQTIC